MRGSTADSCRRRSGWGRASTTGSIANCDRRQRHGVPRMIAEIWPLDEQDQDAELTPARGCLCARRARTRDRAGSSSNWDDTGARGPMPRAFARPCWLGRRGRGESRLWADAAGRLGPPARTASVGSARWASALFLCDPPAFSPARCAIEFRAKCPPWAWRRWDGSSSGRVAESRGVASGRE